MVEGEEIKYPQGSDQKVLHSAGSSSSCFFGPVNPEPTTTPTLSCISSSVRSGVPGCPAGRRSDQGRDYVSAMTLDRLGTRVGGSGQRKGSLGFPDGAAAPRPPTLDPVDAGQPAAHCKLSDGACRNDESLLIRICGANQTIRVCFDAQTSCWLFFSY